MVDISNSNREQISLTHSLTYVSNVGSGGLQNYMNWLNLSLSVSVSLAVVVGVVKFKTLSEMLSGSKNQFL